MNMRNRLRPYVMFWTLYRRWRVFRKTIGNNTSEGKSVVIVPCAPDTVGGSRGDEAMIVATIQHYSALYPSIPMYIVTADELGDNYVRELNYSNVEPLKCWKGVYPVEKIYNSILMCHPKHVCILGADCMDGFYSPYMSLMLLLLHDLFTKTQNVRSHLLAFSFNASPSMMIRYAFKLVNNQLLINLRDPVSLSRYEHMVGKAGLLADTAFCLQYDETFEGYDTLKEWCAKQRSQSRTIVAFNLHPMLRKYNHPNEVIADAQKVSQNLIVMLHKHQKVSLVLLPHDDRQRLSDNTMLSVVFDELKVEFQDRLYCDAKVYRAAQLKGMCGLFDALISSRMHLAIAALGRKVPVMAATYQGKFEGLFLHFGLSEEYLMSPLSFCSDDFLIVVEKFLQDLSGIQNIIKQGLPKVLDMSSQNFQ